METSAGLLAPAPGTRDRLDDTAAGKREVSVLFADLAGFNSFSEGRDPREVSGMLNACFEVAIPPIAREHGGQIDRLIGDAIMATWGTRGDQPDHAERAVRAVAAVQAQTTQIADQHPEWPRFRIAVNSGEALVGVVGAGERAKLHGDRRHGERGGTARGRAPAGGVVVGGATLRAVPGLRATSLGEIEVKGKRETVDAYLLETRLR